MGGWSTDCGWLDYCFILQVAGVSIRASIEYNHNIISGFHTFHWSLITIASVYVVYLFPSLSLSLCDVYSYMYILLCIQKCVSLFCYMILL